MRVPIYRGRSNLMRSPRSTLSKLKVCSRIAQNPLMNEQTKFWVAFSQFPKIGPKRFQELLNFFPNIETAWTGSGSEFIKAGWSEKMTEEFISKRKQIEPDEEWDKLRKYDIKVLIRHSEQYPKLLAETYTPPFLLYYKGNLSAISETTLAVVGSRNITNYGKQITSQITQGLVQQGLTIVSGLALGVDALAHLTAVKHNKPTIAVLGSGIDEPSLYPAMNRTLARNIIEKGGIIFSEYPIGTMPLRHNFPARNRIISGLSLGTVIIEAGETSGALITAHYALEQNREVFAVPGPINSAYSIGTNNLIKRGAKPVTEVEDVLEELNIQAIKNFEANKEIIPDSPEEATVLKHLSGQPIHINELTKLTDLTITEINATLMLLEMKGQIRNLGNMTFAKI